VQKGNSLLNMRVVTTRIPRAYSEKERDCSIGTNISAREGAGIITSSAAVGCTHQLINHKNELDKGRGTDKQGRGPKHERNPRNERGSVYDLLELLRSATCHVGNNCFLVEDITRVRFKLNLGVMTQHRGEGEKKFRKE